MSARLRLLTGRLKPKRALNQLGEYEAIPDNPVNYLWTAWANTLVPGDRVPFGYTRPSGDPYDGNIYIIDTRMFGYRWK